MNDVLIFCGSVLAVAVTAALLVMILAMVVAFAKGLLKGAFLAGKKKDSV